VRPAIASIGAAHVITDQSMDIHLHNGTALKPVNSDSQIRTASVSVVPRATYRIQLHGGFTFKDATALVPYLAELGISHVYCSPFLQARSGSTHGYDIVDHAKINPEIGTPDDYGEFVSTLQRFGMAQMADVVPNHMSVLGAHNAWWFDVLENGPASEYADFFDIDWLPASPDLTGRVLLPVLGDHYGAVLERGELKLQFEPDAGMFTLRYGEFRFPIDSEEYPTILARARAALDSAIADHALCEAFDTVIASFSALPKRREHVAERLTLRRIEKEKCKRSLSVLVGRHPAIGELITQATRSFNGDPEEPGSFDDLHRLLESQAYRLAYWRVASDEINYRRFFDINELAALRMDHAPVFEATHQQIFDFLQKGAISALRIDHPDGLFDPAAYFEALQNHYRRQKSADGMFAVSPEASKPLYVVVEKILAAFEHMPESWAVHGTTGYRFANLVNGVFIDGSAERRMTRIYQSFTDVRSSFEEIATASKRLILRSALASELSVLSNQLARIARSDRKTRDYTLNSLRQALAEVIASFPVYRTYIAADISEADRRYIEWAVARAMRHSHAADTSIFGFIKAVLLCEVTPDGPSSEAMMRRFTRKFQQLTAPVMAKGVEDTAFYIYNRLVSLNDVGGDPARFGYSVRAFHFASAERAEKWPTTMLATSTHDNKRSEDVRARIDVLSELASAWRLQLRRWRRLNRTHKRKVEGVPAPSGNDEYFLYQTLVGSFPVGAATESGLADYRERVERYMIKAVREAKVHSSWLNPHAEYENAILSFVRALLGYERNRFLEDFQSAVAQVAWLGMLNSISTTLIKYTSPGVPDCYQGNELWDFSLADPDNRRAVDYSRRRELLAQLKLAGGESDQRLALLGELFDTPEDGRAKLYVIWRLLSLRRHSPDIFYLGDYCPIETSGARSAHVVSYARRHENSGIIVVAGRLYAGLGVQARMLPDDELWADTRIELPFIDPSTPLLDVLSGVTCTAKDGCLRLGAVCANFPGAVLAYGNASDGFH
jgi:(1->4)-alpha-D-glucan 1-alpha-D-glucosylmutase